MIRLLAIDMDGTLLNSHKEIPHENIDAIQAAIRQGVSVVLCTGRPYVGVKAYYNQLQLPEEPSYAILNNGASTYQTLDWTLQDYQTLGSSALDLLGNLSLPDGVQLTLFDHDHYHLVAEEASDMVRKDAAYLFTDPEPISLERAQKHPSPYFKAMFVGPSDDIDQFEALHDKTLRSLFQTVRSQDYLYEVLPKHVNKASALSKLASQLGISSSEVMAIGDGTNDLEMLTYAGLGVAMGNAPQLVREAADAHTTSNDQAGVAAAIHTYILH